MSSKCVALYLSRIYTESNKDNFLLFTFHFLFYSLSFLISFFLSHFSSSFSSSPPFSLVSISLFYPQSLLHVSLTSLAAQGALHEWHAHGSASPNVRMTLARNGGHSKHFERDTIESTSHSFNTK